MPYQVQDFEREYAGMSDEDLLRLALAPQDLLEDARAALDAEMNRRGLKAARVDAFREEEGEREERLEKETGNRLLDLQWRGVGSSRFCKWDRVSDDIANSEEFTTTVFFTLCWIPLFPIGTYRVRRKKGFGERAKVLQKLPLNWSQVLWVWSVTLMLVLAFVIFIRFAPRLFG